MLFINKVIKKKRIDQLYVCRISNLFHRVAPTVQIMLTHGIYGIKLVIIHLGPIKLTGQKVLVEIALEREINWKCRRTWVSFFLGVSVSKEKP